MRRIDSFKLNEHVWWGEARPAEYVIVALEDYGQDKYVTLRPIKSSLVHDRKRIEGLRTCLNGWGYQADFPIFESREGWINHQQSLLDLLKGAA